ncbi:MAG: hypothetical protein J6P34_03970 [Paludibacteraceae bacterium]|nr:hypothetical protein [Paludibacteraceae bacterium]
MDGDIDVLDLEQLQIFDFPSPVMKVVYDGVEKQGEDTIDFGVCNEELVNKYTTDSIVAFSYYVIRVLVTIL